MKIAVIDNEDGIRNGLVNSILTHIPDVEQIYEANSVKTGSELLKNQAVDLVFMDVELDDGTGMDILSGLDRMDFQLVFITAYNKYAIHAFQFSAIDFIQKPIGREALMDAYDKAVKRLKERNLSQQLEVLRNTLETQSPKKIVLRDAESIHFVKVEEIIRCMSDGAYTRFFLDGKQILVSKNLKEYEGILENYGFMRPHHSHLINLDRIKRFDRLDGGRLIMEDDSEVPVSVRKRNQLMEYIEKHF